MQSCIASLVTFVIASVAIDTMEAGYGRINRYLVARVDTDEAEPNMESALEWFNEQKGKRTSFLSTVPMSDLKRFTALQQVMDHAKCNGRDYEILNSNDKAVGLTESVYHERALRRIDKVILEIFKDHARKCYGIYLENYNEKKRALKGPAAEYVVNLAHSILEKNRLKTPINVYYSSSFLFSRYIARGFKIADATGRDCLRTAIISNAQGDPDVQCLQSRLDGRDSVKAAHREDIKKLVEKYLIAPCKPFVAELGPDLFTPATLDFKFYHELEQSNRNFYFTWVSFILCRTITENEKLVLADVISSVERGQSSIKIGGGAHAVQVD